MSNSRYENLIQPALIYGSIMGGVIILHSVILQIMNASFSNYAMITGYLLPFALLFYLLYSFRKEYRGGIMSYQQGLGMGILINVVYAVIGTVYLVLLIHYINPDYLGLLSQMAEEKLIEKGHDDEMIERSMEMTAWFRSPTGLSVMGFFGIIIMGAIYSLIIMIFLKKEPGDPFASTGS